MSQLQEQNLSRIQNTEGVNNETESAIGFILRSSSISDVNNNDINFLTNNQFQINEVNQQLARLDRVIDFESFIPDNEQENNAPPENQPQNSNNNIDSQVFTRFDFSRMFTNRSPEIKIRYKSIVKMIWKIIELQAVYLVFLLLLCLQCTVLHISKVQFSFITFVLHYGVEVYRSGRDFKRTFKLDDSYLNSIERCKDRNGNEIELNLLIKYKRMCCFCASIENFLLLTTCFMAVLYSTSLFKFYISICIVPLIFEFIIKVICNCKYIVSPLDNAVNTTSIIYSAARIVILLPILLKLDGIMNSSWILALAGYWISFIPLAFTSLFCLALFCNSVHSFANLNVSFHAVAGSYWYTWLTCGITSSTFISMYYFVSIFDNDKLPRTPIRILVSIFLPMFIFQALLIVKTLICITFIEFTIDILTHKCDRK